MNADKPVLIAYDGFRRGASGLSTMPPSFSAHARHW